MSVAMTPQCLKFLKMTLFALNLIVWLLGVVGVCVAGFYLSLMADAANEEQMQQWTGSYVTADKMLLQARGVMCILAIITGSLMAVIGFIGCCGAAADSKCLLVTYAGLIGIGLSVQVIIIGVVVWQKEQAPRSAEELVLTKIRYSQDYDHADWKPIHSVQRQMKCCGVYSYMDYVEANHSVPLSCCNSSLATLSHYQACNSTAGHPHLLTNVSMIYDRGCGKMIRSTIFGYALLGYVILAIVIALQALGFIFSCVIIRSLGIWSSPKPAVDPNRSASYVPTDEVQQYRPVLPAYDSPSRHSSLGGLGAPR